MTRHHCSALASRLEDEEQQRRIKEEEDIQRERQRESKRGILYCMRERGERERGGGEKKVSTFFDM